MKSQLISTLKKYFGYDRFRAYQQEIIETVLNKEDSLVIMPTGGGKSICFQLPALLFDGLTLVISPLIALMKDQVDGLKANGINAAYFNSSISSEEQQELFNQLDKLKLLYVAPESLSQLQGILNEDVLSCIAVDEAHCISSWGHDFRPSYKQLGFLKRTLPNIPIIALTATADKATRQDIADQLNIPEAKQFVASFDRKNISLEVRPANDRITQIIDFIDDKPHESGIIYCLSRKSTENIAGKLQNKGIKAYAYHAGLSFEERSRVQDHFIHDKTQVICATIAFGMGIDKSNIRWVIHYNMPKNIEGYYQEIGRGGRDGLPAQALLFHSYADVIQLRKFAEGSSNEEVQLAKLERMKQFSEATDCRRKILLSYFGELKENDCGNCDVCKNPPQFFNGTVIAQKALSTMVRLKEKEAIGVVIDVLRGAKNANTLDKNYDKIKTYGIGKDISWQDWQHYIIQLINQGFCEIAFHKNNALITNAFSKKVLFEKYPVRLTKPLDKKQLAIKKAKTKKSVSKLGNTLFDRLRRLRLKIAQEEDIPAYLVFNDATLKEMERDRPMSITEMSQISGVGQHKLDMYGGEFLSEILLFMKDKPKRKKKGDTYKITHQLFKQGLSIDEIALKRELSPTTIFSHVAKLYENGEDIDLTKFISTEDIEKVRIAKEKLENPPALRPYFDFFEEKMEYYKIRLALTILSKEEN
jgi:ATP-dependent DNA helicase RecQ